MTTTVVQKEVEQGLTLPPPITGSPSTGGEGVLAPRPQTQTKQETENQNDKKNKIKLREECKKQKLQKEKKEGFVSFLVLFGVFVVSLAIFAGFAWTDAASDKEEADAVVLYGILGVTTIFFGAIRCLSFL